MPAQNNSTSASSRAPKQAMSWAGVARGAAKRPSTGPSQAPPAAPAPAPSASAWPSLPTARPPPPRPTPPPKATTTTATAATAAAQAPANSDWQALPADALVGDWNDWKPRRNKAQSKASIKSADAVAAGDYTSPNHATRLIWALRNDALLVSIDVEKWMIPPEPWDGDEHKLVRQISATTEVGISVSDPSDLPAASRLDLNQRLRGIRARHVRIREVCHLTNPWKKYYRGVCKWGCHDHFQFGRTEFASAEQMKVMLREMLRVPAADGAFRPVALLFHDSGNDEEDLQKSFDVDLKSPDFAHVFIIDTQKVARRQASGNPIGLSELLSDSNIVTDHAHNSGNDAIRTLAAGLIDGIRKDEERRKLEEPQEQPRQSASSSGPASPTAGSESPGSASTQEVSWEDAAAAVAQLQLQPRPMRPDEALEEVRTRCRGVHQFPSAQTKGVLAFCDRCRSTKHVRADCSARVLCARCGDKRHLTEMCVFVHVKSCQLDGNCPRGCFRD